MEKEQMLSDVEKEEKRKQEAIDLKVIAVTGTGVLLGLLYTILDSFGVI